MRTMFSYRQIAGDRVGILGVVLGLSLLIHFKVTGAESKQPVTLADPTILLDQGIYYLYGTEAPPQRGFKVYKSNDLSDWHPAGNSTLGEYALDYGSNTYGDKGFWAPQVVRDNDQFILAYTANEHIAMASSASPLGPFTQETPHSIDDQQRQIDPFIFTDDDGRSYLYHVRFKRGNHIYVAELNSQKSAIIENTLTHCLSAQDNSWEKTDSLPKANVVEGPSVIKHQGIYYLIYSANHFKSADYAVGYATATSPFGPWQHANNNPIIHQSTTGRKGSGHGDLFQDKSGHWQYVFHAHHSAEQVHPRETLIVPIDFVAQEGQPSKLVAQSNQVRTLLF